MPDYTRLPSGLEVFNYVNGTISIKRDSISLAVSYTERDDFLKAVDEHRTSRFACFSDEELAVIDFALSEDEGNWRDTEKEKVRHELCLECRRVIDQRH
jgi:hypothetical protein